MLSKMTLGDKLLIGFLIIASFTWLGLIILFYSNEGNKIVEIVVYGDLVEKLSLTEDAAETYSFKYGENTGYIEVKDGAVRMLEMDKETCPESICSNTGWIKESYEAIVCMPNGIIVNIKEDKDNNLDNDIDVIA